MTYDHAEDNQTTVNTQPSTQTTQPSTQINKLEQADIVLGAYVTEKLGMPSKDQYFSPYEIGIFIGRGHNEVVDSVKITRFKLIKYLTTNKLVLIKTTAMYRLVLLSSEGMVCNDES